MKILPIASGSSGNSFFVNISGNGILIDVGVSGRCINSALTKNGFSFGSIDAVLITHTHIDHVKYIDLLKSKIQAPVYMSTETKLSLCFLNGIDLQYCIKTEIKPGLFITAFRTSHDCFGSSGFLIETEDEKLGYLTDLGVFPQETLEAFFGVNVMVIESNHDIMMLKNGRYPVSLKRRILSEKGHLSNEACGEAVQTLESHGTHHFILAHLSRENNIPELALKTVSGYIKEKNTTIDVLHPKSSTMHVFGEEAGQSTEQMSLFCGS